MCSSTWDCRVLWWSSTAWIDSVRRFSYSQPVLQLLVSSALLAWLHLKCQVQHMIFIPQQTTYDSHNPMFDLFSSVFLAWVQRLCLTSHMLDVLTNFEPAQRKYVWVYRGTRMEKRWQWLTGCEIQLVPQTRLQPHGSNVYRADVAASPSSLLLIVFATASPPYSSALQSESRPHPLSSRGHWKSASAWKWCHREKEIKC